MLREIIGCVYQLSPLEAADLSARVIGLEAPAAADLRVRLLDAQLRETAVVE